MKNQDLNNMATSPREILKSLLGDLTYTNTHNNTHAHTSSTLTLPFNGSSKQARKQSKPEMQGGFV